MFYTIPKFLYEEILAKLRKAENGSSVLRNELTSTEKLRTTLELRMRIKKLE